MLILLIGKRLTFTTYHHFYRIRGVHDYHDDHDGGERVLFCGRVRALRPALSVRRLFCNGGRVSRSKVHEF